MGECLDERTWQLASLPVPMGGFGLRTPLLHAHTAHFACLISKSQQILKLLPAAAAPLEKDIQTALVAFIFSLLRRSSPDQIVTQSSLSERIDNIVLAELLTVPDERFHALLVQLQSREANAWKRALPNARKHHHLLPPLFQIAMKRNLGVPLLHLDEDDEPLNCPLCLEWNPPDTRPL